MSVNETLFEKSKRINGFAQHDSVFERYKRENNSAEQTLNDLYIDRSRIEPVLITNLGDYLKQIEKYIANNQNASDKNPIFYRVHENANYYNVPSALRGENEIKNEDWSYRESIRKYPEQFEKCKNTFERLVVMQHYGSETRCLDLTESPLATLGFACVAEGKFPSKNASDSDYRFATVTVFQAPEEKNHEFIKYPDSSTVSVIANCAIMEKHFRYGNLDIAYKNDGFSNHLHEFIYFRDILRRSVIVRACQNNPRIKNQKGAFIIVNANRLIKFPQSEFGVGSDEFMDAVFKEKIEDVTFPANLTRLKDGTCRSLKIDTSKFRGCNEWNFEFEKVVPYSLDNKEKIFQDDPFDLKRFYYKPDGKKQLVFFIPPKAKKEIRKQLEMLGFGYDMLYPEVDTVFHEIGRRMKEDKQDIEEGRLCTLI